MIEIFDTFSCVTFYPYSSFPIMVPSYDFSNPNLHENDFTYFDDAIGRDELCIGVVFWIILLPAPTSS